MRAFLRHLKVICKNDDDDDIHEELCVVLYALVKIMKSTGEASPKFSYLLDDYH